MPRLHGYRERLPLNMYDAFSPSDLSGPGAFTGYRSSPTRAATPIRIFGNKNIGQPDLTNAEMAGQMSGDQTAIITNWYARANIPTPDTTGAFGAWTHSTTVTLKIGEKPMVVLPLAELLFRRDGKSNIKALDEPSMSSPEAYEAYRERHNRSNISILPPWDDLDGHQRLGWGALDGLQRERLPRPLIIPPRQAYSVHIDTEIRALSALLEVMPNVAPRALVWVHLEGLITRDVG